MVRVNDALQERARELLEETARAGGSTAAWWCWPSPISPRRLPHRVGRRAPGDRATIEGAIEEAVARYVAARRGEVYMPEVSWRAEP